MNLDPTPALIYLFFVAAVMLVCLLPFAIYDLLT